MPLPSSVRPPRPRRCSPPAQRLGPHHPGVRRRARRRGAAPGAPARPGRRHPRGRRSRRADRLRTGLAGRLPLPARRRGAHPVGERRIRRRRTGEGARRRPALRLVGRPPLGHPGAGLRRGRRRADRPGRAGCRRRPARGRRGEHRRPAGPHRAPAFAAGLHWSAWQRALRSGTEASRLAGDVAEQAYFHHELGVLALCEGHLDRARAELEASIGLRGALSDKRGAVAGRRALALVADRAGTPPASAPARSAGRGRCRTRRRRPRPRPRGGGARRPERESASPLAGVPRPSPPSSRPPQSPTLVTSREASTGPSPQGGRRHQGLRASATSSPPERALLLVAVLGTVVTLGATSENDAGDPSDQVGVNPSASQGVDDGSLGADRPSDDGANPGDTGRPTDPGPDGTVGTSDDPTPSESASPSDGPSDSGEPDDPSSPDPGDSNEPDDPSSSSKPPTSDKPSDPPSSPEPSDSGSESASESPSGEPSPSQSSSSGTGTTSPETSTSASRSSTPSPPPPAPAGTATASQSQHRDQRHGHQHGDAERLGPGDGSGSSDVPRNKHGTARRAGSRHGPGPSQYVVGDARSEQPQLVVLDAPRWRCSPAPGSRYRGPWRTRACGLISWAAKTPRTEARWGSRFNSSR